MSQLTLQHISKRFGDLQAVAGVSFDVSQGEILALLGPSGCGKSTLLRIIAGLLPPDEGQLFWDGESILALPPHQRKFSLMFQDYALFPHLNVEANITFGLRMNHASAEVTSRRVREVLELVGLLGYERRDVQTLSGGEQQRAALARALAPDPKLLMLDEPLGALDRTLRERLLEELIIILRGTGQTVIYVTHDQEEAFALADRVVILNAGKIEQIDTPVNLYARPASSFVASFIGLTNLLPGQVIRRGKETVVQTAIGEYGVQSIVDGRVQVLVRPEAIHLREQEGCALPGRVVSCQYHGSVYRYQVSVGEASLSFEAPYTDGSLIPGESVCLWLDDKHAFQVFPNA